MSFPNLPSRYMYSPEGTNFNFLKNYCFCLSLASVCFLFLFFKPQSDTFIRWKFLLCDNGSAKCPESFLNSLANHLPLVSVIIFQPLLNIFTKHAFLKWMRLLIIFSQIQKPQKKPSSIIGWHSYEKFHRNCNLFIVVYVLWIICKNVQCVQKKKCIQLWGKY